MNQRTKLLNAYYVIGFLTLVIITKLIDDFWLVENCFYKNLLISILPTIASFLGLGAIWEIIGKRSFSQDVLNLAGVSDNYIESGITHVYKSFNDINWDNELLNAESLTIFFVYGRTWRNHNRRLLTEFAKNNKLTVILPDYRDDDIISELDRRFCYGKYSNSEKKISARDYIEEAVEDFNKMGSHVKFYKGTICSSYYFMDDKCICSPFKHGESRIDVPAILATKGGSYYNFCMNDKELIEMKSIDHKEVNNEE